MNWKLGEAKQQLSKVVRLAQKEPQLLQNRELLVAVVVGAEDFGLFREWRQHREKTLAQAFAELREVARDEAWRFETPNRTDRSNAFLGMVGAEGRSLKQKKSSDKGV